MVFQNWYHGGFADVLNSLVLLFLYVGKVLLEVVQLEAQCIGQFLGFVRFLAISIGVRFMRFAAFFKRFDALHELPVVDSELFQLREVFLSRRKVLFRLSYIVSKSVIFLFELADVPFEHFQLAQTKLGRNDHVFGGPVLKA